MKRWHIIGFLKALRIICNKERNARSNGCKDKDKLQRIQIQFIFI